MLKKLFLSLICLILPCLVSANTNNEFQISIKNTAKDSQIYVNVNYSPYAVIQENQTITIPWSSVGSNGSIDLTAMFKNDSGQVYIGSYSADQSGNIYFYRSAPLYTAYSVTDSGLVAYSGMPFNVNVICPKCQ